MKVVFDAKRFGDISAGRENLGPDMPVAVYRLLMYNLMDELKDRFDDEEANDIMRATGFRAGINLGDQLLKKTDDFNAFIVDLQETLKNLRIGIVRIESADLEKLNFVLTVSEDLDCSGLPMADDTVCIYDEGFISGLLYHATGKVFKVKEVDCWANGDRTCRFEASAQESN